MKEPSLSQILLNEINSTQGWLTKGTLALKAEQEGFLGETAGRVLRTLAENGKIKVDYYLSKRNKELARYAKNGTEKPIPPTNTITIEMRDGMPIAVSNENIPPINGVLTAVY